jgi:predicted peptidase
MKQHRLDTTIVKPAQLGYLLHIPHNAPTPLPLLLFLHGIGERGNDLEKLYVYGPPAQIRAGREFPCAVLAPQCPDHIWWDIEVLNTLLDHVVAEHNIDTSRIWATGLSMGGHGLWNLANAYPDRFAAIAPICGPHVWVVAERFKNLPCWCFHGALDDAVPISDSIRIVRDLRQAGCPVRFTVFPDAGHDSWTPAYNLPEFYEWLFAQHKE